MSYHDKFIRECFSNMYLMGFKKFGKILLDIDQVGNEQLRKTVSYDKQKKTPVDSSYASSGYAKSEHFDITLEQFVNEMQKSLFF